MNVREVFISIKNRNITFKQRKYIFAFAKRVLEDESAGADGLIWFNVYCALNKRTVDWYFRRNFATLECRKELMKRSANYLRSNKPNIP